MGQGWGTINHPQILTDQLILIWSFFFIYVIGYLKKIRTDLDRFHMIWSYLIQCCVFWSNLIWFELICSSWSGLNQFIQFDPVWSSLVQFGPINLIKSTLIWFETWNNQLQPGLAWHILLASFCAFYAIFNSYLFLILSVLIWLADVIVRSIMAYTYLHVLILYFGSVIWFISGAMFALYELFFPHEIRALGRFENLRGTTNIYQGLFKEKFLLLFLPKSRGGAPQFLRPW